MLADMKKNITKSFRRKKFEEEDDRKPLKKSNSPLNRKSLGVSFKGLKSVRSPTKPEAILSKSMTRRLEANLPETELSF